MQQSQFRHLFQKYADGLCSPEEEILLMLWLADPASETKRLELVEKYFDQLTETHTMPVWRADSMFQYIIRSGKQRIPQPSAKRVSLLRWMKRIAVAAAVLVVMLGAGYWIKMFDRKQEQSLAEQKEPTPSIGPGTNKAVLILTDGSMIELDSAANGKLAQQGATSILKEEGGTVTYQESRNSSSSLTIAYNTLQTPKGGEYQLILPDGSKVWLNASSSITYPVRFAGKERKVSVTGEVYFEVRHDPGKPFRVSTGITEVEVLGTQFNINAYNDEPSVNTTLVEGSVKVGMPGNQRSHVSSYKVLLPGQQSQVTLSGTSRPHTIRPVNVPEVIAWKNGYFSFQGTDLYSIMRQVARWYDVEIIFEKQVNEKFYAEISRQTPVTELLQMLTATEAVHFKIEGKKIIVTP